MPQDAPADTAGPSSPPPRLPEGWLPQWEGVQRQWYYVQRTTGKSQWEIPTEPVVLTPSTTPTSIGTGPSQAPPSRPSTNSPQVAQGNTLAEQLGSLADGARISSSLDAQLTGQWPNPTHGSSETGQYANQAEQHLPYAYGRQLASAHGGYGTESQHRGSSGNTGMGSAGVFPGHLHQSMGQQAFAQPYPRTHWGRSGSAEHITDPYQGHALGPMPFLQRSAHGAPASHIPNVGFEHHLPEPQWRVPQQPVLSNSTSQWTGSSNLSQPLFVSQYASQGSGQSAGNLAPQSLQFSNHSILDGNPNASGFEPMHESFARHPDGSMDHSNPSMGYPLARSHSQHGASYHQQGFPDPAAMVHPPQGYQSQPSSSRGEYHSTSMARAQSGPGFGSLGFPAVPDAHGNAHEYQNPLVQVGAQQYLPKQHDSHHGIAHQYYAASPTAHQGQRSDAPASVRIAPSDSQFVSGPWASSTATPPSPGLGRPSQQG